ncbi:acetyltransferase [Clostridium algidicarnis]|uniref:acetyltransferase n=1 Tax=Clostridium algidicarnis TaxID=37659 RepID=UPI001CF5C48B|nr:acetyltransferase [Clostridium algidicarnis]MCB2287722.1 acetyltransferase [Clostridium algidicarnis]
MRDRISKGEYRMEKIILIGSGQHANVVLYNIKCQNKYEVIGYFESDIHKVNKYYNNLQVLKCYKDQDLKQLIKKYNTNKFFIGFGNMEYRKRVFKQFVNDGWEPVNIFHPNAVISKYAHIGRGVLIECGCLITPNPIIGDNVVVNTGSQVNHDNVIEDHVYIASGVILSGGVTIGENTLIDDGVIVTLGKKIGQNCLIGAGSVVTKNIENDVVAYGNPAKVVRKNEQI